MLATEGRTKSPRKSTVGPVKGVGAVDLSKLAGTIPVDLDLVSIDKLKGSTLSSVKWAGNQLCDAMLGRIPDWSSAPCKVAIPLLLMAVENSAGRVEFWKMWAKTIPTKSTIEKHERYRDDGRKSLESIDRLEAGWRSQGVFGMSEKAGRRNGRGAVS